MPTWLIVFFVIASLIVGYFGHGLVALGTVRVLEYQRDEARRQHKAQKARADETEGYRVAWMDRANLLEGEGNALANERDQAVRDLAANIRDLAAARREADDLRASVGHQGLPGWVDRTLPVLGAEQAAWLSDVPAAVGTAHLEDVASRTVDVKAVTAA